MISYDNFVIFETILFGRKLVLTFLLLYHYIVMPLSVCICREYYIHRNITTDAYIVIVNDYLTLTPLFNISNLSIKGSL